MKGGERAAIAAVMAGGSGSRLGGAKAAARLGGRPLIEHAVAAATGAGLETVVVAKQTSALPPLPVSLWLEPDEPSHPLCGVLSALERAGDRAVIVVACDMPFVTSELIAHLAGSNAPLAVPNLWGRLHPLLGRYTPELIGSLAPALDARRPLGDTVAELDPLLIEEPELRRFGDPERLLFNVNSPDDLERAERLVVGKGS